MAKKPVQKTDSPEYPTVTTRVSRDNDNWLENQNRFTRELLTINALFPNEVYTVMDNLFVTDPYCSKYLFTTVALGNQGHELEIDASNETEAKLAIEAANNFAARCYPRGGGMDGAVNALLSQAARGGGLCCEWVPDLELTQVKEVVLIPLSTIVFRRKNEIDLELCQKQQKGITPLNQVQTSYHAIFTRDNNPYPIPPALAALESAANHKKISSSIRDWMDKLSALGVMFAELTPPPRKIGETQEKYDERCEIYLKKIAKTIGENFKSGIGLGFNNIKFTFNNTQAGAGGAKDVLQIVLQGLFAALQRDPIFFGWTYSKSETFATVVYEEMSQGLKRYQLSVKRAVEHGHRLNLALQGLGGTGVSVKFKRMGSLDAFRDSQAKQMDMTTIVTPFTAGLITSEEARKDLGYDSPNAKSGEFVASFDQQRNRYALTPFERKVWGGFDTAPAWKAELLGE